MSNFIEAISLKDLEPGSSQVVYIENKEIALFNIDGKIYAIDDCCPHASAPLSDGEVEGCEVECPLHGARFDLTTGENLTPPAMEPVMMYKVKIENEQVYVAL